MPNNTTAICSARRPVPEPEGPHDVPLSAPVDGRPSGRPPTYRSPVLSWRQGDTIPLSRNRTLRVLGVRDDDAEQPPVLVVEDLSRPATSDAA